MDSLKLIVGSAENNIVGVLCKARGWGVKGYQKATPIAEVCEAVYVLCSTPYRYPSPDGRRGG